MSAYKTPYGDWVDLRSSAPNPVTIATGLGFGLHASGADRKDVGINDLVTAANTAVLATEGLNLQNRGVAGTVCLVHKAASSFALDSILDIVFRFDGSIINMGVASEIVCDDPTVVSAANNVTYGISVDGAGAVTVLHRFVSYASGITGLVSGTWYRYTLTNMNMQAIHTITTLASGDPSDWDGGTVHGTPYADTNGSLAGGNVAVPYVNIVAGTNDSYIAAVRVTPRRRSV